MSAPASDPLPRLPPRPADAHKGSFGRVLIVATSPGMTGAGVLAARAALRSGAGLVTLAVPCGLLPVVGAQLTSAMSLGLPETSAGTLGPSAAEALRAAAAAATVVAVGPGLGRDPATGALLASVLPQVERPLVVDADGLWHLAGDPGWLAGHAAPIVLTPHPGEMARLVGTDIAAVQSDRAGAARRFAAQHGVVLLLKGRASVIAEGERHWLNATGNAGMATGGTGDVLTGVVAALLGQGLSARDAARLGAHVHGLAGDLASDAVGPISLIADDLVDGLPLAFRQLTPDN